MVNFLELIKLNKEEVISKLESAFKEAVDNRHLDFVVEIDCNGKVCYFYVPANANTRSIASFEGKSYEIKRFGFETLEIENNIEEGETEKEWLDWYKSNYAYEAAENAYDMAIEGLREYYKA